MPYTETADRHPIDCALVRMPTNMTHGDLTYAITRLITRYVEEHGQRYTVMSQARSAAQDAADEFYRRVMAPYEDRKCADNGDVYGSLEVT